ncbi:hypothetical protein [Bacteroides sp. ET336]|uniref:hypothetical protein n=1 Tax=Bacteroides sp. ET336 TaxID=2972459 RepID=UPI0021AC0DD2|nr:hypothetical protein [Bacteroides sp. ET336]
MNEFKNIFNENKSWTLSYDAETNFVNGISGKGNKVFDAIVHSINKYLGSSSGSVIDYGVLKDAIDRHCDTVENDIAVQTPIPLYCGLAGTMAGVIIGLWDLLDSQAILTLMGSGTVNISNASDIAANGINDLLLGVAWAMAASICGIILTTLNSVLFKRCKLEEESGKNSFLAWMQSKLLPELPSDTSEALGKLVKNLNKFNATFADNTNNLGKALAKVNESYAIQAEVIKTVHDMDVMKMAKVNINVLQELKECTCKLEDFNLYLDEIKGYTDAIHRFESMFKSEAERLHILEEIRDFFNRHKGEIAKDTGDADIALRDSLKTIKESTAANMTELNAKFVEQSENFKSIIKEEQETFKRISNEITTQFETQLKQMPLLKQQLEGISAIPEHLNILIEKIEESNKTLAQEITTSVQHAVSQLNQRIPEVKENNKYSNTENQIVVQSMPNWMRISGWCALIIIALTSLLFLSAIILDYLGIIYL